MGSVPARQPGTTYHDFGIANSVRLGSGEFAGMIKESAWLLAGFLALWAGGLDLRYRRIPNWLTLPGLIAGIVVNTVSGGWPGAKSSLLGAGLGLLVLLPFVLIRALGAGDWKLTGALGACLGPMRLVVVLVGSMFVAGIMAIVLIVYKRRVRESARNIAHMVASFLTLHLPGSEVSLDNPQAAKIPFGVAVAVTVLLFGIRRALGMV
jgi:prepilin peptidase CpaA